MRNRLETRKEVVLYWGVSSWPIANGKVEAGSEEASHRWLPDCIEYNKVDKRPPLGEGVLLSPPPGKEQSPPSLDCPYQDCFAICLASCERTLRVGWRLLLKSDVLSCLGKHGFQLRVRLWFCNHPRRGKLSRVVILWRLWNLQTLSQHAYGPELKDSDLDHQRRSGNSHI